MKKILIITLVAFAFVAGGQTFFSSLFRPKFDWASLNGKTIVFEGDSYTYGTGASDNAHRWTTLLCAQIGAIEVNRGVAGKVLDNAFVCSGYTVFDMASITAFTGTEAFYVIGLGVNDVGLNNGRTVAAFKARYITLVATAIAAGIKPSQILILSPWYIATTGGYNYYYSNYSGSCGVTAPADVARHLAYRDATLQVATQYHTYWYDTRSAEIKATGGIPNSWLSADSIHLTDFGQAGVENLLHNADLRQQ